MSFARTARALPTLLRVGFAEALAYRAEMLVWILSTTMPLVMLALFSAVDEGGPLGRFDEAGFAAYFLATFIVRQFTACWASWEINEHAITLRAGGGDSGNWLGSVGIKVSMNSAWRVNAGLLDPGDHFAWIGGGTAGTSGLWSSLWTSTIDPMGRAAAMTLDLSKVNWDVQYVIPDSILNDTDTYTRVLSMTEEFEERGGAVIPTPGTISLRGAGVRVLATAWGRGRREIGRGQV